MLFLPSVNVLGNFLSIGHKLASFWKREPRFFSFEVHPTFNPSSLLPVLTLLQDPVAMNWGPEQALTSSYCCCYAFCHSDKTSKAGSMHGIWQTVATKYVCFKIKTLRAGDAAQYRAHAWMH